MEIIEQLSENEINNLISNAVRVWKPDIIDNLNSLLRNIYLGKELSCCYLNPVEMFSKKIQFQKLISLNDSESPLMEKPTEFYDNDDFDYRFSRDVLDRSIQKCFLTVVGNSWYRNKYNDEFVESIVFSKDINMEIDCFEMNIRKNCKR